MWLLPSKGRPELCKRWLDSCVAMKMSTPGVIILDESDKTICDYQKLDLPKDWTLYIVGDSPNEPNVSMAKSIRVWMKENQDFVDSCKWLGFQNDDMICKTENWDQRLLEHLKDYSIIAANDDWLAPQRLTGPAIYSGPLLRLVGYFYPPGLNHMYIDNVWEMLAVNTGLWTTHMGVHVEHDHWTKHKREDETTKHAESFLFKDKATCQIWMEEHAQKLVDKIKEKVKDQKQFTQGIHLLF